MLSVCIITKNESNNIFQCLQSVRWADEIILVDDFSEDETVNIASQFQNVKIFKHKFEGFGQQKQFAVEQARNDWVFNIDADEIMTEDLQREILNVLNQKNNIFKGYSVRRLNYVFGKKKMDAFPVCSILFHPKAPKKVKGK